MSKEDPMMALTTMSTSPRSSPVPAGRSLRRKPVPTPRNTLKKPVRRQPDQDSQGQTSLDSNSPEETSAFLGDRKNGLEVVDGEDILAALEKIPGVGSLRSVQSSVGSSLPSLCLEKVKREESSHSLETHSLSSGQSCPAPESTKESSSSRFRSRFRRFHTEKRPARLRKQQSSTEEEESSMSKPSSPSKASSSSPDETKEAANDHEQTKSEKQVVVTLDRPTADDVNEPKMAKMQARPLPELPELTSGPANVDEISVIHPEGQQEAVYSTLQMSPDHYTELQDKSCSSPRLPQTPEMCSLLKNPSNGYLTMTGTMRKGRQKREECLYDIQLGFNQEHLSRLEKRVHDKYHDRCFCGVRRGVHVFLLSLLSLPFLWVYSTALAFYLGTLTWYNIFIYYNEDRGCCYKLLSPFVLLAYPIWIIPVTLLLGLYGAVAQISWYFDSWVQCIRAPDGGFFGWFCDYIDVPDCSPYQIIILSMSDYERPCTGATML